MRQTQGDTLLNLQIVGAQYKGAVAGGRKALGQVVVSLHLQLRLCAESMLPPAQQIGAVDHDVGLLQLVFRRPIHVALHGGGVIGSSAVDAKPRLPFGPGVAGSRAAGQIQGLAVKTHAVEPIGGVIIEPAAVAYGGISLHGARRSADQRAVGHLGRSRNDVDDAIHRIGTPQRCARAADHLDPIHIL